MTVNNTLTDPVVPAEGSRLMRLVALPGRAVGRIFRKGPIDSLKWIRFLCRERYCEWQLGVCTAGTFDWDEESGVDSNCVGTEPTSYQILDTIVQDAKVQPGKEVLIDYGCGKGRSVVAMATQPFKKVIGVEMAGELCDIARENVRRAQSKLKTPDVDITQTDATTYDVPTDVTVVYMYNPFGGYVLDAVLGKIHESLQAVPRALKIYYLFPELESNRLDVCDWLTPTGELPTGSMTWLQLYVYEYNG